MARWGWLVVVAACEKHPTEPVVSITLDPLPTATVSVSPPSPTASAVTPSPRCIGVCNKKHSRACDFCRSHQIGVDPENFENADRACTQTCQAHYDQCLADCARDAGP